MKLVSNACMVNNTKKMIVTVFVLTKRNTTHQLIDDENDGAFLKIEYIVKWFGVRTRIYLYAGNLELDRPIVYVFVGEAACTSIQERMNCRIL